MRGQFATIGLFALAVAAGCGFNPHPKDGKLPCNSGCPSGYVCRISENRCYLASTPLADSGVDGEDGALAEAGSGVARDGSRGHDVGDAEEAGGADTETGTDTNDSSLDAPVGTGGTGGNGDAAVDGAGGSGGNAVGGGSAATGGTGNAGGTANLGGTVAQGGAGGTLDAGAPDAPLDAPAHDGAPQATPDAPGSCRVDTDCPAPSPLCLANKCAKCTSDSDCVGRAGTPVCATTSGLCVACTANSSCTADPSKAFCVSNACVGCSAAGASACSTRTDGRTTCATSGTVAGQCAVCAPGGLQCSATGAPQICSGSGVWQDQPTGCGTNYACSPTTGQCSCTKKACSPTSCVDTMGTDANNCGSCGHLCGTGGTCSAGQCQPVAVVGNAGTYSKVIGVDNSNVYYYALDVSHTVATAFQVDKTVANSAGTLVDSGSGAGYYIGVIGTLLIAGNRGAYYMCQYSSASPGECSATNAQVINTGLGTGTVVPFKSTSQQNIATLDVYNSGEALITWDSTSNATRQPSFHDIPNSASFAYNSPFALGDTVYWIRSLYDSSHTLTESILYSTSLEQPTLTALSDTMPVDAYVIVDVNSQSVLLTGPSGLYRVALPGDASKAPPFLVSLGSSLAAGATEDASRVYWLLSTGTLFSCVPSDCAGTKTALATGQTPIGDLYQDTSSLYWSNGSQIMRLAK
jgi:hypothetical protein